MSSPFEGLRCLVIGFGSIGERHARILAENGGLVTVISRRSDISYQSESCIENISEDINSFDYVVVANSTQDHYRAICQLSEAGYTGGLLVEKPLFERSYDLSRISINKKNIFVGYNLRFHPALSRLRNHLLNEKILSAQIYCGSYLPHWRKDRDFRQVISSSSKKYGGVIRELSHELDYATWLLGPIDKLSAAHGHFSHLDMQADDLLVLIANTKKCPAMSMELNFFDRIGCRKIRVNTDEASYVVDLKFHTFMRNEEIVSYEVDIDQTYLDMHFSVLTRDFATVCNLEQGMEIMETIDCIAKCDFPMTSVQYLT